MSEMKSIGILTSGGDAPGMNAAIRAVVRAGIHHGMQVYGVRNGYTGLINMDMHELDLRGVSDILHRGGTVLGSARCLEFKKPEVVKETAEKVKASGIDGMVVIGGDGSFRGARDLSLAGLPTIALPGTIDNDIDCTDYTIGFDTALNTVSDCVDKIRDTTLSHNRCTFVEVMGKEAGYIALSAGIAGGSEAILIPEKEFDIQEDIVQMILDCRARGKYHYVIVIAEGVGNTQEIAKKTEEILREEHNIELEIRACILGHIQRGGNPTVEDRIVASQMGVHAVDLLTKGIGNRVVVKKDGKITDLDILEGLNMKKTVDADMLRLADILSL